MTTMDLIRRYEALQRKLERKEAEYGLLLFLAGAELTRDNVIRRSLFRTRAHLKVCRRRVNLLYGHIDDPVVRPGPAFLRRLQPALQI